MRLIDADALLEKAWDADTRIGYVQVVDVGDVIDAPTISPDEFRSKGKWIVKKTALGNEYTVCSNCEVDIAIHTTRGEIVHADMREARYCPNCGARMEDTE